MAKAAVTRLDSLEVVLLPCASIVKPILDAFVVPRADRATRFRTLHLKTDRANRRERAAGVLRNLFASEMRRWPAWVANRQKVIWLATGRSLRKASNRC